MKAFLIVATSIIFTHATLQAQSSSNLTFDQLEQFENTYNLPSLMGTYNPATQTWTLPSFNNIPLYNDLNTNTLSSLSSSNDLSSLFVYTEYLAQENQQPYPISTKTLQSLSSTEVNATINQLFSADSKSWAYTNMMALARIAINNPTVLSSASVNQYITALVQYASAVNSPVDIKGVMIPNIGVLPATMGDQIISLIASFLPSISDQNQTTINALLNGITQPQVSQMSSSTLTSLLDNAISSNFASQMSPYIGRIIRWAPATMGDQIISSIAYSLSYISDQNQTIINTLLSSITPEQASMVSISTLTSFFNNAVDGNASSTTWSYINSLISLFPATMGDQIISSIASLLPSISDKNQTIRNILLSYITPERASIVSATTLSLLLNNAVKNNIALSVVGSFILRCPFDVIMQVNLDASVSQAALDFMFNNITSSQVATLPISITAASRSFITNFVSYIGTSNVSQASFGQIISSIPSIYAPQVVAKLSDLILIIPIPSGVYVILKNITPTWIQSLSSSFQPVTNISDFLAVVIGTNYKLSQSQMQAMQDVNGDTYIQAIGDVLKNSNYNAMSWNLFPNNIVMLEKIFAKITPEQAKQATPYSINVFLSGVASFGQQYNAMLGISDIVKKFSFDSINKLVFSLTSLSNQTLSEQASSLTPLDVLMDNFVPFSSSLLPRVANYIAQQHSETSKTLFQEYLTHTKQSLTNVSGLSPAAKQAFLPTSSAAAPALEKNMPVDAVPRIRSFEVVDFE